MFQSDSPSPRRTKMLRFRCVADGCRALNLKPMNPHCFAKGTAFAQCSKCGVWHLIKDNLELFNQLKGEPAAGCRANPALQAQSTVAC